MGRLPFDPDRVTGPGDAGGPARRERRQYGSVTEAEQLTVTQVAELIKSTLEQRIASPLRVVGQVSNLRAQNHWYFSLKDDAAVISCVAWASSARGFGFMPADGDEVVATGHVSHYPPQGRTQFYVTKLAPVGAGALELRFRALCEELRRAGYFDASRKQPLPAFPRRIAVITSAGSAAVQDVIATAAQRCPAVGLLIVDARVQGDGAAEQIARAMRHVDAERDRLGVDAILVTRGGGSMEDLWAFNERIVADAALACRLPLVAAIGHESDTTVIELVADRRASTPTQAAMLLVPSAAELTRQVDHLGDRLRFVLRRRLSAERERTMRRHERLRAVSGARVAAGRVRLERLAGRLAGLQPAALLARRRERLTGLAERLHRATATRLDRRPELDRHARRLRAALRLRLDRERAALAARERQLTAVDPRAVLARGFSYTTRGADGRLVRSREEVRAGDDLVTHVADGRIDSVVTGDGAAPPPPPAPPSPKRSRRGGPGPDDEAEQMDLFGGSG